MLIDWFTVGAQALNFVILVWLLKHFLYKPILSAIDAREKRIATELADADRQKIEAQKARDEFQVKNVTFDADRDALLAKVALEAKAERERLLNDARTEAGALLARHQTAMHNDAATLGAELTRLATVEVFNIARQALGDLATAELEERLAEVFTRRLREMKPNAKEPLGAALKNASNTAVVRSRFDLGAREKATIQNALNESFSADIRLRFETTPDSICGIELTTGGERLSWSIADYLKSLEQTVGGLLAANAVSTSAAQLIKADASTAPVVAVAAAAPAARAVNAVAS